jgi:iron complex outermembrane recepter protein
MVVPVVRRSESTHGSRQEQADMTTRSRTAGNRVIANSLPLALAVASLPLLGGMPSPSVAQIEEILVTASRRTETDIQTTALSISAITANDIDQLTPRDLGDIAGLVPNFSAAKPAGFNAASFAMRGVGQTSIIVYQDPQVGVTIDDFVIPHIQTQLLEMFDIAQVEVLRGPQGTLYGKNTTGGVVNVRTKRPVMNESSLEASAKAESFGRFETRIAGNVGVSETLALRAAGIYLKSDGYWRNNAEYGPVTAFDPAHPALGTSGRGDGSKQGGDDAISGRLKALWEPTAGFSALLQYEIIRDDGDSPPVANGTPVGAPLVFNFLGLTADPGGSQVKKAGITNRDDLLLNMSSGHQVDVDGYYLNLDWLVGDYTLSSVTGFRKQDSELPSTYTGEAGPNSLFDANRSDERETFQQELRIASSLSGPFNFVAGGFYQEDETTFCVAQVLGFLDLLGLGSQFFGDPVWWDNNPQILCNRQKADNWALFFDGSYDLDDRWTVSGGFRYTNEKKRWTGRNQVFFQQLAGGFDPDLTWRDFSSPLGAADFNRFPDGVFRDSKTWKEPTWRVTVSHTFSDDLFGYLNYSRGFKSGAYNDQTGTSGSPITAASAAPTDPEIADSFELGVKSTFLDNRLRLNLATFYVEYTDAQRDLVAVFDNPFGGSFQETRFFNAADMTSYGLEVEMIAAVTDSFMLRGNLGWLKSEYDEFQADTNFDGTIDIDLSDEDVNRAPEWQWNVDAIYHHPFLNGELSWVANASFEDEAIFVYSNVAPQYHGMTDKRTLLNASVTYTDVNERFFARLYGRNLTDKEYRVGELPVANLWTMTYYGLPRAYGLEIGTKLGGN